MLWCNSQLQNPGHGTTISYKSARKVSLQIFIKIQVSRLHFCPQYGEGKRKLSGAKYSIQNIMAYGIALTAVWPGGLYTLRQINRYCVQNGCMLSLEVNSIMFCHKSCCLPSQLCLGFPWHVSVIRCIVETRTQAIVTSQSFLSLCIERVQYVNDSE